MADELTLLGIYYSIASLILVYQIFVLQAWASEVDQMAAQVATAKRGTKGTSPWDEALASCKTLRSSFPRAIAFTTCTIILLFTILGLGLSSNLTIPPVYTVTPIVSFGLFAIGTPLYVRSMWRKKLDGYVHDLS